MRRRVAALLVVGTFAVTAAGVSPAVSTSALPRDVAVALKACNRGWAHAVIGGEHKCLRSGQFCSRRYVAQYRRHGYTCKPGSDGRLRLHRR